MLFDDLEQGELEADAAIEEAIDDFFETPEGMKQQIANLQQDNGILVAQHERMEMLLREYRGQLPMTFVECAQEAGFYEPVYF